MQHIGIDLGGRESQICARTEDGTIRWEGKRSTSTLGWWLKRQPRSRVILETSAEAFAVADGALAADHEVRVVPATLVRSLGVGQRRIKTDKRDAQLLSQVSCRIDLPSVHIPSEEARQYKATCTAREALTTARTKLINSARGWLRTQLVRIRTGSTRTFPARVREKLGGDGREVPAFIERILVAVEVLNTQVAEADKDLQALAKSSPACQRLMTAPGVGPVTAVRFVAALDQPQRFRGAHAVESYLGLTPGENSSADRQRRTGITKAGSSKVRWVLVQACWTAMRCRPQDPMVRWAKQVADRRGRKIAIVAMARKLAGILYAMWRDGTVYKPQQDTQPLLIRRIGRPAA